MGLNHLFIKAMAAVLFLILLPVIVQGQAEPQIFQLVTIEENKCLQILDYGGTFVPCEINFTIAKNTVFLANPNPPGNLKIQIFGTPYCLDREHCHSSTSDMRYSDCNHCGAVHWTIDINDGSVREDGNNNCIYNDSGNAYIHHCSIGFQKFKVSNLGNHFQLKSVRYGDCFAGDKFMNCASAPTFYTTGLPGYLSIHIDKDPDNRCIDREHCHSDTSNIRLYDCSHCGAIHWTLNIPSVTEDGLNNCVNRYGDNGTRMEHCTDSFEAFSIVIIPNNVSMTEKIMDNSPTQTSLKTVYLDSRKYFEMELSSGLRGVRLSRCIDHGVWEPVMELELVHYLPYIIPNAQYMVTRIHLNIPYSNSLSIFDIMNRMAKDNYLINMYKLYYGITDGSVTNNDGLLSNFVTNHGGVPTTGYTATTINELLQGLKNSAFDNDQYYESFYIGQNNGYQWYLDFIPKESISLPLYWPKELSLNGKRFHNLCCHM